MTQFLYWNAHTHIVMLHALLLFIDVRVLMNEDALTSMSLNNGVSESPEVRRILDIF